MTDPNNTGVVILCLCGSVPFFLGLLVGAVFTKRYLTFGIAGLLPGFIARMIETIKDV